MKYREDIVQGLENAPRAFIRLMTHENFGKLIVKFGGVARSECLSMPGDVPRLGRVADLSAQIRGLPRLL